MAKQEIEFALRAQLTVISRLQYTVGPPPNLVTTHPISVFKHLSSSSTTIERAIKLHV